MKDTMRRRSLKKRIAFLLALSMVCSFPCTIGAEAALSDIGESSSSQTAVMTESSYDELPEVQADTQENIVGGKQENDILPSYAGRVDVSIGSALFIDSNVEFTVTLTGSNGYSRENTVTLEYVSVNYG